MKMLLHILILSLIPVVMPCGNSYEENLKKLTDEFNTIHRIENCIKTLLLFDIKELVRDNNGQIVNNNDHHSVDNCKYSRSWLKIVTEVDKHLVLPLGMTQLIQDTNDSHEAADKINKRRELGKKLKRQRSRSLIPMIDKSSCKDINPEVLSCKDMVYESNFFDFYYSIIEDDGSIFIEEKAFKRSFQARHSIEPLASYLYGRRVKIKQAIDSKQNYKMQKAVDATIVKKDKTVE